MVYLNKVTEGTKAEVAAKLEIMEPCCSVKDRIGLAMINSAEREGAISREFSMLTSSTRSFKSPRTMPLSAQKI